VLAAIALREMQQVDSAAMAKRNVRAAIERVASRLGNTPAICRKCYVHPEVVNSYLEGSLLLEIQEEVDAELRNDLATLGPEEAAVLALLRGRLRQSLAPPSKRVSAPRKRVRRTAAGVQRSVQRGGGAPLRIS
jgi:DNA topoisomerase-1